ncbi:MAG: hypothetical protein WBG90_20760 [Saonia sp.]
MDRARLYFRRTIEFCKIGNPDFAKLIDATDLHDLDNFHKLFESHLELLYTSKKTDLTKLREIYAIEKEKVKHRDSEETVTKLYESEKTQTLQRESMLKMDFIQLLNINLIKNPAITTYESDWEWIVKEENLYLFDVKKIQKAAQKDHFFLFERTGTYNGFLDTNIFEYPLNEYEYILLEIFEKAMTGSNAINKFFGLFVTETKDEEQQFFGLSEKLLRNLIFKRFVVKKDG